MKKRFLPLLLCLMLLTACTASGETTYQKNSHYFFGTFDTMISLTAYTKTQEEFQTYASLAESEMRRYHYIFDLYNDYPNVNNLYAVNANAPQGPTPAEPELIDLLLLIRSWHEQYSTQANPAMGSVLTLWHDARTQGNFLPDGDALQKASAHTDFSQVIIDEEAQTIAFADPEIRLDLGAVAKGYAAQLVADTLRGAGLDSFLFNAGGNVVCGGAPLDGREYWTIAIEDVDGSTMRIMLGAVNQSVVTSGDYQRYYEFNGERYHHLIDPETLYPARHMRAVSIIHPDSGLADFLSTTAFLLPYEQSRALIESIPEAEALWTLYDGSEWATDGFQALVDRVQ